MFTAVARDEGEAVVRAGPDGIRVKAGRCNREYCAVDLGTVLVFGNRTSGIAQRFRIATGKVRADLFPGLSIIPGAPEVLRRRIEDVRIKRREDDRKGPLPPLFEVFGGHARKEERIDLNVP